MSEVTVKDKGGRAIDPAAILPGNIDRGTVEQWEWYDADKGVFVVEIPAYGVRAERPKSDHANAEAMHRKNCAILAALNAGKAVVRQKVDRRPPDGATVRTLREAY